MLSIGFAAKALGVFVLAFVASRVGASSGRPRAVSGEIDQRLTPGWVLLLIAALAVASWPLRMANTWIALGSWIVGAFLLGHLSERLVWARSGPEKTRAWVERVKREEAGKAIRQWATSYASYQSGARASMGRAVGGGGVFDGRVAENALGGRPIAASAEGVFAAKEKLARLGEAAVPFLVEALFAGTIPGRDVRAELVRIGPPALEAALLCEDPELSEWAAGELGRLSDQGVEVLARHVSDEKWGIRKRVILALKSSQDERARRVLEKVGSTEQNYELLQLLRS
jgi:hypothetical protein